MKEFCIVCAVLLTATGKSQDFDILEVRREINANFSAFDLNDRGDLCGASTLGSLPRAAAYVDGTFRVFDAPTSRSRGLALNNVGTMVGYHEAPGVDPVGAYWTADGAYHHIPLLEGGTSSIGLTIEDDGTMAGIAEGPDGPQMAIWRNGQIETYGWIPGDWYASVKDYGGGKFIGDLHGTVEGDLRGSFIFDTVSRELTTYDLYSTERPFTMLWDINNLGQAVGEESLGLGNGYGGVLIDDGVATSFGTGFRPFQVSDTGQMTGLSEDAQDRLVYRDGVVERIDDLLPIGWDITILGEINIHGQMLVRGNYEGGPIKQLLLTPVPEPASCIALGLGVLLILRRRRSKD